MTDYPNQPANATHPQIDSKLVHDADGRFRAAVGPDAVNLYRVVVLRSAINMHISTGGRMRLTRIASPSLLLQQAGGVTGKKYTRRQFEQAAADLTVWIDTMKAALPQETLPARGIAGSA
jgi:hypothetical protein